MKPTEGSLFAGDFHDAMNMAEELVGYFYAHPRRDTGEPDAAYAARCEADRQAVIVQMLSNAAYAMDYAMVHRTVQVIQDGTFQNASMFHYNGASSWRQLVGKWIDETFTGVSWSLKSRVLDTITILWPALQQTGVAASLDDVISLIIDRGELMMPGKVRLANETIKDAVEAGGVSRELAQQVWDMMRDQTVDVERAQESLGRPKRQKHHGVAKLTANGWRFEVEVPDEATARVIERRLSGLVEWEWEK